MMLLEKNLKEKNKVPDTRRGFPRFRSSSILLAVCLSVLLWGGSGLSPVLSQTAGVTAIQITPLNGSIGPGCPIAIDATMYNCKHLSTSSFIMSISSFCGFKSSAANQGGQCNVTGGSGGCNPMPSGQDWTNFQDIIVSSVGGTPRIGTRYRSGFDYYFQSFNCSWPGVPGATNDNAFQGIELCTNNITDLDRCDGYQLSQMRYNNGGGCSPGAGPIGPITFTIPVGMPAGTYYVNVDPCTPVPTFT